MFTVYDSSFDCQIEKMLSDRCKIISIDIGIKNFAIRIESRENSIETVLFEKIDLSKGNVFTNLSNYFEKIKDKISNANLVLIEHQISRNHKCTSLMNCVIFYFIVNKKILSDRYAVITVNSKLKNLLLKPDAKKVDLKKQTVIVAQQLLEERNDEESLSILKNHKKKDDLADVIVQIQAFIKHVTKKMKI